MSDRRKKQANSSRNRILFWAMKIPLFLNKQKCVHTRFIYERSEYIKRNILTRR